MLDGMEDGDVLGIDDGKIVRALDGVELGVKVGVIEGNAVGADDGSVLGISLVDGVEDGAVLGTDDGQLPHVALHVWKKPETLHRFLVAIAHVLVLFFLK